MKHVLFNHFFHERLPLSVLRKAMPMFWLIHNHNPVLSFKKPSRSVGKVSTPTCHGHLKTSGRGRRCCETVWFFRGPEGQNLSSCFGCPGLGFACYWGILKVNAIQWYTGYTLNKRTFIGGTFGKQNPGTPLPKQTTSFFSAGLGVGEGRPEQGHRCRHGASRIELLSFGAQRKEGGVCSETQKINVCSFGWQLQNTGKDVDVIFEV